MLAPLALRGSSVAGAALAVGERGEAGVEQGGVAEAGAAAEGPAALLLLPPSSMGMRLPMLAGVAAGVGALAAGERGEGVGTVVAGAAAEGLLVLVLLLVPSTATRLLLLAVRRAGAATGAGAAAGAAGVGAEGAAVGLPPSTGMRLACKRGAERQV